MTYVMTKEVYATKLKVISRGARGCISSISIVLCVDFTILILLSVVKIKIVKVKLISKSKSNRIGGYDLLEDSFSF